MIHLEASYFRVQDKHEEEYMKAVPYLNILAPQTEDYMGLTEKVKFLEDSVSVRKWKFRSYVLKLKKTWIQNSAFKRHKRSLKS